MNGKATMPSVQCISGNMRRIVAVGTSGSGKTTLTRQLCAPPFTTGYPRLAGRDGR